MTSYTAALSTAQVARLRELLEAGDYEFLEKPYAIFSARKGKLNVTVYEKGPKVLVQGKETEDFVRFTLEPEVLGEARLGYEEVLEPEKFAPHFGIDESGKGDYFGPLVVAGVYTDAEVTRRLIELGIMDSKRISSSARIRKLAAAIREVPGCVVQVILIGPERYNEMMESFGNLNRLLAWGHAAVIAKLAATRPDCPRALSDQFARPEILQRALAKQNVNIEIEQRTKGESDTAVAAASIIARERFVDWMERTSQAAGVTLPLGASSAVIAAAKEMISIHGGESLRKTAKLHFRTTREILG